MSDTGSVSTYRRIVKATGLFGGVQVIGILCSVIRSKLIAVWLGAEGVGIIGLYNTAVELIMAVTGLGLRQSGVRDISQAAAADDKAALRIMITVLRRLSWIAGLAGAVITLSLAPLLSRWTFGDDKYIWGFVCLSCTLLFNALISGEQVVLQGLGRLKPLAKSSILASVISLILSVPMYYYWRISGIVPALILISVLTLFFTRIFSRKITASGVGLSVSETWQKGKSMAVLGIYMTVSGFLTTLLNYIFIAWMNYRSGTADVGYYQAGFTLVTRYVGLVFVAMSTEYYPRLSAVSNDNKLVGEQVSRQAETSVLILLPVISLFILCQSLIIRLLYTSDFLCISGYISWAILGMLFKAVSWTMAFVLLAKNAGKMYLLTEFLSDIISLGLNIAGYQWWGLDGLGIAYLLNFFLYAAGMWYVTRCYYTLRLEKDFYQVFAIGLILCILVFVSYNYLPAFWSVVFSIIFTSVSIVYSVILLKKRLNLKMNSLSFGKDDK